MKLYYSPASCALATHIALCETALPFELEAVDLRTKKCAGGSVLTEGAAVLQYVADRKPEAGLVPAVGTMDRYRVQEALSWIGTELHKAFGAQFAPGVPEAWREATRAAIVRHFDRVNGWLAEREWIAGSRYSVADIYLFVVIGWAPRVKIDLARWPAITAYHARIAVRPAVQQAMRAEGLIG